MKKFTCLLVVLCLLFVVSCRNENQIKKMYGHWKCEQESFSGYKTLAFTEKEMDYSKDRNILVIYESKDGVVAH